MSRLLLASLVAALLPAVVGGHTVHQKGKVFSSTTLTVKAGESIEFVNDDEVTHNVFSTSAGNQFNLKAQSPGAAAHVALKPGTVEVRCAFHPTMKLTVQVAP